MSVLLNFTVNFYEPVVLCICIEIKDNKDIGNSVHLIEIVLKEHTVGLTGQQRMLIPLLHLILALIFVEVRVSSAPVLYFALNFWFWTPFDIKTFHFYSALMTKIKIKEKKIITRILTTFLKTLYNQTYVIFCYF